MSKSKDLVPMDEITRRIVVVRGRRVMLDADLAELYEVETRVLVQAVKRNIERFPSDFMFQLTHDEFFVSEGAARQGIEVTNPSKTDPIVMLKHFGPENPDLVL